MNSSEVKYPLINQNFLLARIWPAPQLIMFVTGIDAS